MKEDTPGIFSKSEPRNDSPIYLARKFLIFSNYRELNSKSFIKCLGIDNASDADSVIKAGREILSDKGSQGNLVEKAEEDEDVATTMKEKIDAYKNAFWKLLDEAGLDGGQIPCATRLNAIRQKCVESSPDY
ncbi:uncharacterized protein LOC135838762 [Planococcus citri]|uniref:uncharacterized protein LOC135838762 n=1 Tax=Planococcus citri TaxID=170843 RepID=UPI0031F978C1